MSNVLMITPRQVMARVARGEEVSFLDCRSDDDWRHAEWKLSGAVRAEAGSLAEGAARVPRFGTVVVYGERGWEFAPFGTVDRLRALGYSDVRILSGGFAAWSELHYPIEPAREHRA